MKLLDGRNADLSTNWLFSKKPVVGSELNQFTNLVNWYYCTNPIKDLTCLCCISLRFLSFSSAARSFSSSSSCCCAAIAAWSFSASSFCSRNASTSREENCLHWFSMPQAFMSLCQLIPVYIFPNSFNFWFIGLFLDFLGTLLGFS